MKIDQIIHAYTYTASHRDGNMAKVTRRFIKSNLGWETLHSPKVICSQVKTVLSLEEAWCILQILHTRNQDTRTQIVNARLYSLMPHVCWSECDLGQWLLLVCRRPVLRPPALPVIQIRPLLQIQLRSDWFRAGAEASHWSGAGGQ